MKVDQINNKNKEIIVCINSSHTAPKNIVINLINRSLMKMSINLSNQSNETTSLFQ